MYRTLPIKANFDDEEKAFWVDQCEHSNSLYNCAVYEVKQRHYEMLKNKKAYTTYWRGDDLRSGWKTFKIESNYCQLDKVLKQNKHYKALAAQSAQQTLKSLGESITSYNKLVDRYYKGEGDRPSIPRYRKSGGLNAVTFPSQALNYFDECIVPSVSKGTKPEMIAPIRIELPHFISFDWVREITIRPCRGEFWIDYVIDDGKKSIENNPNLNYNHAISIDHGVKFWLSAVTTKGKSFIVESPHLKTALHKYRNQVQQHKKNKPGKFWDEYLDKLTAKRNLQIRDAVNKAARFITNRCLKDGIGNLVIGWNEGNKTNINIGRSNNYEVVSMPTKRLIERLKQLCEEYGVRFHVTSEEYTSKASFVDRDDLHQYGEKPKEWKPSGRRISRDVYRTKEGLLIHADLNAAANILRKVADQIFPNRLRRKIHFEMIKRGALTCPKRYDIFRNLKKKYRKQTTSRSTANGCKVTTA
ncbi:MAG: transposase [Calothrix sp. MO_167.B12]|nr:transposase [Calothrix sp. MO_167.B12]